jgi:hypothetical protein
VSCAPSLTSWGLCRCSFVTEVKKYADHVTTGAQVLVRAACRPIGLQAKPTIRALGAGGQARGDSGC